MQGNCSVVGGMVFTLTIRTLIGVGKRIEVRVTSTIPLIPGSSPRQALTFYPPGRREVSATL